MTILSFHEDELQVYSNASKDVAFTGTCIQYIGPPRSLPAMKVSHVACMVSS